MERLVAFLPALDQGPFHVLSGGYRSLNERLVGFYEHVYRSGLIFPFDWSTWAHGPGADLVAGVGIDHADQDAIRRTLTAHVRHDRFCEGHLLAVIERGDMAALVRRLAALQESPRWSFRVGTWNVELPPRSRSDRQRQCIEAGDADIWVLTETRDTLDLSEAFQPVSTTERPGGERWVTVWSRLPLVETVLLRDPMRTAAAVFEGPAGPIVVVGTVLPWHADRGPTGTARNWTEHHRVIPEQAAEWAELAARYPKATLCVAGDFNSDLAETHIYGTALGRSLLEVGLASAKLLCATRTVGGLTHPPIDHVAVSGTVRARVVASWEGTVDGERLSDHSAVVVEASGAGSA